MIYRDDCLIELPYEVKQIIEILEDAGYDTWLVGGSVRDALLKRPFNDYDIATASPIKATTDLLQNKGYVIHPTGIKHGTVTAVKNKLAVEITRFRVDGDYVDNRHPENVKFVSTIQEDLKRRDFTINALAYHPTRGILDCYGGINDMNNHLIRAIDDPKQRFREDALRIMRACRFSSQLGFSIEPDTFQAMCSHKMLLQSISKERIRKEIELLLLGKDSCKALLDTSTVLCAVLPEITASIGFEQATPYHIYDVWEHTAHVVEHTPPDLVTRLAALFHDSGKPAAHYKTGNRSHFFRHEHMSMILTRGALNRLGWSKRVVEQVLFLVEYHDVQIKTDLQSICKSIQAFRCDLDLFSKLVDLKIADALSQSALGKNRLHTAYELKDGISRIEQEGAVYSVKQLDIAGSDLLELGIEPGPEIGRILQHLLIEVIEGRIVNKRSALIEAYISWKNPPR